MVTSAGARLAAPLQTIATRVRATLPTLGQGVKSRLGAQLIPVANPGRGTPTTRKRCAIDRYKRLQDHARAAYDRYR
jgi:hypothetical protein